MHAEIVFVCRKTNTINHKMGQCEARGSSKPSERKTPNKENLQSKINSIRNGNAFCDIFEKGHRYFVIFCFFKIIRVIKKYFCIEFHRKILSGPQLNFMEFLDAHQKRIEIPLRLSQLEAINSCGRKTFISLFRKRAEGSRTFIKRFETHIFQPLPFMQNIKNKSKPENYF